MNHMDVRPIFSLRDKLLDLIGEVVDRNINVLHLRAFQAIQDVGQDRLVPDRQERLGRGPRSFP